MNSTNGDESAWGSIPDNMSDPFYITFPTTGLVTFDGPMVINLVDVINGPSVSVNGPYSILSLTSIGVP